jgi:hypothetical protein
MEELGEGVNKDDDKDNWYLNFCMYASAISLVGINLVCFIASFCVPASLKLSVIFGNSFC